MEISKYKCDDKKHYAKKTKLTANLNPKLFKFHQILSH